MEMTEKVERLQAMLKRMSPNDLGRLNVPVSTHESATVSTPWGGTPTDSERALHKFNEGRLDQLTPAEVSNTEAIILPYNRPVAFVRYDPAIGMDSYDDLTGDFTYLNPPEKKKFISGLFSSIGRIELAPPTVIPFVGTGFVVGNGLLMTNRHVAEVFASRTDSSSVNFRRQVDTSGDDRVESLKVVKVEMIHPYWDMALLRVEGLSSSKALTLSLTSPESLLKQDERGNDIVVVGYPARDYRNDLDVEDRVFEKIYNVKRVQPGVLHPRDTTESFKKQVKAWIHDASTLGGNSGSAVIHVQSGTVVGLHFGGSYLVANYAVPTYELACDPRVARVLGLAGKISPTTLCDAAWAATSSAERPAPPPSPRPVPVPARVDPPSSSSINVIGPLNVTGSLNITGPQTVTVPPNVTLSIGMPTLQSPREAEMVTEAVAALDFELARAISAYVPLLQNSYALAAKTPYVFLAGYTKLAEVRVGGTEAPDAEFALTPEQEMAVERDRKALEKGASSERTESLADPSAFGFVAREETTGSVLVTIRGTQTPAEWLADFIPVPVPFFEAPTMGLVHVGFAVFYRKVRQSILEAMSQVSPTTRITVVGHSLGGAMAVLCAADIKRNMGKTNVDLCTFGGPRTGKFDFRIHFNRLIQKCYRIVDALDIVPHVPSVITGWNHVGVEIDVAGKGGSSPHSLEAYLDGLNKLGQGGAEEAVTSAGEVLSIQVL